ncbi:MAG: hypothetical protein COV52_00310 [Gammaproteobacteria bacterium CG11_big_fil_rev_8_21_14_0_20_46_22]|nr:MAG: hypothetical protein COW05_09195 [Gammaproteobacteria bacterium CG12_big_fil_rev_8_21_14_0_65_46_12]PIR12101.1 MAG: hypothetical protein COV52_00310 [Gammaproteobacteria bacterium CG11_big_fil_rev_8_21_14_0_20_46_22]
MNKALPIKMLRMGLAVFIALLVQDYAGLTQGFWVPMTTMIVLQASLGSTLRRGLQRFLGTLLGILIGSTIVVFIHDAWLAQALLVLTVFLAFYAKAFNITNYGIFVVPLSAMVVMLIATVAPNETLHLIPARCYDTGLGALIAVIMSAVFFPVGQIRTLKESFIRTENAVKQYLLSFQKDAKSLNDARNLLEQSLSENRTLYADAFYEIVWLPKKRRALHETMLGFEKTAQLLCGLENVYAEADHALKLQILKATRALSKARKATPHKDDQKPSETLWHQYLAALEANHLAEIQA